MHGAPVPSPVYSEVDAVISAGYMGQGHQSNSAALSDFHILSLQIAESGNAVTECVEW